ncbi:uncharacterized protein [Antedon mediterranea]|uniref:uncharacterized protein n=1 Tax=Antedon mediterranea TaxID=105859 RepID=UPI003AF8CFC7
MTKILSLLLIASFVVLTAGAACSVNVFKKIDPPDVKLFYKRTGLKAKTNNSSFHFESCGPPEDPPFHFTSIPSIVTSRTKSVNMTLIFRLDADMYDSFFVSGYVNLFGDKPIPFGDAFDCTSIPVDCPLPLQEKDWVQLSVECLTTVLLPVTGKIEAKAAISNYTQTAFCIKGELNIYK